MSLKDLTADKHAEAESTPFMKAVFARNLPFELWIDWTYQKTLFYGTIEGAAGALGLLRDLPDIRRNFYLWQDVQAVYRGPRLQYRQVVKDYHNYLMSISKDPDKITAHLYVWHLGDLFGGQMIRRMIPGRHYALTFKDPEILIRNLRMMATDDKAEEAIVAFDWAIKMMRDYDTSLEQD